MTNGTTTATGAHGGEGHRHDRHCYWDHLRCGWVCGPRPAQEPEREREAASPPEPSLAITR
jgi:hypothetical protein